MRRTAASHKGHVYCGHCVDAILEDAPRTVCRLVSCAVNVTVAGIEYPLYSHVHHGFGLNDAFDASVSLLVLQVRRPHNSLRFFVQPKHHVSLSGIKCRAVAPAG